MVGDGVVIGWRLAEESGASGMAVLACKAVNILATPMTL